MTAAILAQRGALVLHGAALQHRGSGKTYIILAPSGVGKSFLANAAGQDTWQSTWTVLGDDIAPLELGPTGKITLLAGMAGPRRWQQHHRRCPNLASADPAMATSEVAGPGLSRFWRRYSYRRLSSARSTAVALRRACARASSGKNRQPGAACDWLGTAKNKQPRSYFSAPEPRRRPPTMAMWLPAHYQRRARPLAQPPSATGRELTLSRVATCNTAILPASVAVIVRYF